MGTTLPSSLGIGRDSQGSEQLWSIFGHGVMAIASHNRSRGVIVVRRLLRPGFLEITAKLEDGTGFGLGVRVDRATKHDRAYSSVGEIVGHSF